MYDARRDITLPARMFSLTDSSRKSTGATIRTRPAARSSSLTTARTPPKWSTWLWVWITATTGRSATCSRIIAIAARIGSTVISGSTTIQPESVRRKLATARSKPRAW